MPLSKKDLSDIANEFATSKGEQVDDKAAIPNVQEQVDKKNEQAARLYILYNDAHIERVTPYETERRWLDGTTYTTITKPQIETFAPDTGKATYFYPVSWTKSSAQLQPNGNGNPQTSSSNSEQAVLQATLDNNGLIASVLLLLNGQSTGAPSRTLDLAYSPGSPTLTFTTSHSFAIGNLLWVSGSGTSALVRVTATTSLTVDITEIIAPASTISIGGTAASNVAGFTNTERQNLTSALYQRILTELTNRISTAAGLYNTALTNQLAQLNINIDAPTQITAAKTSISTAKTAYTTWSTAPATGVGGRWTDTVLGNFTTSYNSRNSGIAARVGQITTALGSVSQDAEGNYSGNGNYLQRFKCLNFLINTANGPLQQAFSLTAAKGNFEQKVINNADKLATFSNLVRYAGLTKDPVGNTITVDGASQFAPGDAVLLCGKDLPSTECTISSISGTSVVLSITVPKEFTKAAKSGIIKRV